MFLVLYNDSKIPPAIRLKVTANESIGVICIPMYGRNIFDPMNIRIIASAGFKYEKRHTAAANKKYNDLSPNIANILLVYTTNKSCVIKNIAGILSTAKMTSISSIINRAKKRGVM